MYHLDHLLMSTLRSRLGSSITTKLKEISTRRNYLFYVEVINVICMWP